LGVSVNKEARFGAEPNTFVPALPDRMYRSDSFVLQVLKVFKNITIVTAKAGIGANPDKTVFILEDFKNFGRRQALVASYILDNISRHLGSGRSPGKKKGKCYYERRFEATRFNQVQKAVLFLKYTN
jgi:hypothetical protein